MRQRLFYLAFLVLPLAVYIPVLLNEYGQGGDFAMLHLSKIDADNSAAVAGETVLYRALLDSSFAAVHGVQSLWAIRLLSVLLISLLGILLWRQLDNSGWNEVDAAAVGMLIILLPAAQVMASWALCWPRLLAILFSVAGFAAVEAELEAGGLKRVVAMLGGAFIYALAAMIRPELVFFGLVPLGGVVLFKIRKNPASQSVGGWVLLHVAVLVTGWLVGRLLEHWASGAAFATADGVKQAALWFFLDALPGSVALLPLLDDNHVGAWYFWPLFLAVAGAIFWTFRLEQQLDGEKARTKAVFCLVVLPLVFLFAVLPSGDIAPTGYREAYPLAGIVVVALLAGWRTVHRSKKVKTWGHYGGLAGIVAIAAILAHWNTQSLLAGPRAEEWQLLRASLAPVTFKSVQRVHLLTAGEDDRNTARLYGNEIGAPASASEAVLREMFEAALRQRFPGGLPRGGGTEVTVGAVEPPAGSYDVLVDMRKLKDAGR